MQMLVGPFSVIFRAALLVFGILCIGAGMKLFFTARSQSYDSHSLRTNLTTGVLLILLGVFLACPVLYRLIKTFAAGL